MNKKNKLLNIIAFCALMQNNDGIIGKSPDYILEKFERYCLSNRNDEWKWGLDNRKKSIIKQWVNKWQKHRKKDIDEWLKNYY